ncbi:hypothetical protein ONE63_003577 [Megalurothrips usitatus]|uniref:Uncharacterized protein n=1 Tax=Megalurothrips usitatus TaxID=439358 RepID=A0AAV7X7N4_9NEOP|nr:hypothetical protein ONE63_003577 [Megalurothrips usitatus]
MVGVSPSNDAAGLQNEVRALDILDSVLSQAQDGHEVGDATVPPFLGSVLSQAIGQRCSDANAMALRGPHQLSTPMDTQNINNLHVESSDSITTGNITVFHQPVTLNTAAPVRFGQGKVSHNESKERIRTDVAAPPKLASRGCRRFMRWPWVLVPTAVVAVLIAVITVVVLVSGSTTSAETTTWGPTSTATDWTKTPTNQTDTSTTPADQTDPTTVATVTDPSPGTSSVTTTITTTTEVCGKNMFLCKNGNCIDIMKKCSGTDNCGDGSDEDPLLCDVPMRNITVGTKVMARLEYRPEHEAVWILMCGSDSCSRLVVQGYSSLDGSLAYDSYTNCTLKGQNCLAGGSGSPGQMVPFSAGNVSFFVTHSDTQGLKVALRMHEDYATSVVAPADSKHLWIRPQLWYFDMPTTYYEYLRFSQRLPAGEVAARQPTSCVAGLPIQEKMRRF